MSTNIDTVVFDLGGVLIHVDHDLAVEWLVANGASIATIEEFVSHTGMLEHERGELPGEQFYARVKELLDPGVSTSQLHAWWTGFFRPNEKMLELARRVGHRYRVFILSNTGPLHWQQARDQFALDTLAEEALTSFEAGVAKPDARIYHLAEEKFRLQPTRTVFIDDLVANTVAAASAGWRSIHHRGFDQTVPQLRDLGLDF